jgi:hypothetical protein
MDHALDVKASTGIEVQNKSVNTTDDELMRSNVEDALRSLHTRPMERIP